VAQASASDIYESHRLSLGVAEGASELSGELPLELNLDALGAISFNKGCYVGQELTSRTHFRGVIRKRAAPIAYDANADAVCRGDVVMSDGAAGAAVGRVLAARGGRGVALLRLAGVAVLGREGAAPTALLAERAAASADADAPQQQPGARVAVTAHRPAWWPHAWGSEA
jgi:hypothetical protein